MRTPHLLAPVALLTLVNLGLLAFQLARTPAAAAQPDEMLRVRGLQIVDDQGRVRSEIKVEPANEAKGYSDTVIFRLVTPDGKPRVKLTTSREGAGLLLLGDGDETFARLKGNGKVSTLELVNADGTKHTLTP